MLFSLEKSQGDSEEDQLTFTRSQRDPRLEMQLLMQIPQHTGSFLGATTSGVLGHDRGQQQDNNTTMWWFPKSPRRGEACQTSGVFLISEGRRAR